MNLVQRMVAENLQSVTSQELAESLGMTHEEFCRFVKEYQKEIETSSPLQIVKDGFILNSKHLFAAVIMAEMSDQFYALEGKTSADKLKMDMKASCIKLLNVLLNVHERRTGKRLEIFPDLFKTQNQGE